MINNLTAMEIAMKGSEESAEENIQTVFDHDFSMGSRALLPRETKQLNMNHSRDILNEHNNNWKIPHHVRQYLQGAPEIVIQHTLYYVRKIKRIKKCTITRARTQAIAFLVWHRLSGISFDLYCCMVCAIPPSLKKHVYEFRKLCMSGMSQGDLHGMIAESLRQYHLNLRRQNTSTCNYHMIVNATIPMFIRKRESSRRLQRIHKRKVHLIHVFGGRKTL